jgi:hypothetical protein
VIIRVVKIYLIASFTAQMATNLVVAYLTTVPAISDSEAASTKVMAEAAATIA